MNTDFLETQRENALRLVYEREQEFANIQMQIDILYKHLTLAEKKLQEARENYDTIKLEINVLKEKEKAQFSQNQAFETQNV